MAKAFIVSRIDSGLDDMIDGSITAVFSDATKIRNGSFSFCRSLKVADFPKATKLEYDAFWACENLASVNFPKAATIGANAFGECISLDQAKFPEVVKIDERAFRYSGIRKIDFPKIETIGIYAFESCQSLLSLIVRTSSICALAHSNALDETPVKDGYGYIYVPKTLVEQYKVAASWSAYAAQFRAIEDYPEITGK